MSFVRPVLLVLRTWHAEGPLFPSRIIHHTICHCSFANSCFCSEWLYHAIMFVCFQHHHSLHQMPEHILVAVHFTSLYANPLKFILSYDSYFFFSFLLRSLHLYNFLSARVGRTYTIERKMRSQDCRLHVPGSSVRFPCTITAILSKTVTGIIS